MGVVSMEGARLCTNLTVTLTAWDWGGKAAPTQSCSENNSSLRLRILRRNSEF